MVIFSHFIVMLSFPRLLATYLRHTKKRPICCARCQQRLAKRSSIFTVPGAEGMAGAYVNPHGCVHETITVRRLLPPADHNDSDNDDAVFLQGMPTTEDSWFPG